MGEADNVFVPAVLGVLLWPLGGNGHRCSAGRPHVYILSHLFLGLVFTGFRWAVPSTAQWNNKQQALCFPLTIYSLHYSAFLWLFTLLSCIAHTFFFSPRYKRTLMHSLLLSFHIVVSLGGVRYKFEGVRYREQHHFPLLCDDTHTHTQNSMCFNDTEESTSCRKLYS